MECHVLPIPTVEKDKQSQSWEIVTSAWFWQHYNFVIQNKVKMGTAGLLSSKRDTQHISICQSEVCTAAIVMNVVLRTGIALVGSDYQLSSDI